MTASRTRPSGRPPAEVGGHEPQTGLRAPAGQGALAGWMRPLAAATIALVTVVSIREHPSPGLHGSGLTVTATLLVLVASVTTFARHSRPTSVRTLAVVAMILASSALLWVQPGAAAQAGLFVAVSVAALWLSARVSGAVLALALVGVAVTAIHTGRPPLGAIAGLELGIVAFYVIASFARRLRETQEQTERLLVELEASRQSQAETAALRERSRLARDMHDVLAHSLSGLTLQLEGARMLSSLPNSNGQLSEALDRAHHLARAGLEEARRAIGALRDEDLPGPDRLEQLTADFERDSSAKASFEVTGSPRGMDSETSLTLYRVAQEALTNSRKHGHPQRVELRLSYEPDGTRLVVQDHSERGTPAAETVAGEGNGYGLTGMRERAALLGGRLEAAPTGDGFRVELWVPA